MFIAGQLSSNKKVQGGGKQAMSYDCVAIYNSVCTQDTKEKHVKRYQ